MLVLLNFLPAVYRLWEAGYEGQGQCRQSMSGNVQCTHCAVHPDLPEPICPRQGYMQKGGVNLGYLKKRGRSCKHIRGSTGLKYNGSVSWIGIA